MSYNNYTSAGTLIINRRITDSMQAAAGLQ